MKYIDVNGHKLSALSLGTAQLGMDYGIANNKGQPSLDQSFDILNSALDSGVTSIDTAVMYGNSEEVIGAFLRQHKGEVPFITTKLWHPEGETCEEVESWFIRAAESALERLGVDRVNNIMIHSASDLVKFGDKAAKAMRKLVDRGYTDLTGVSVYTNDDVEEVLKYPEFDTIQVPMSIFDQRLIHTGALEKLHKAGMTVFVRSVFLQGVFFLDPDTMTEPYFIDEVAPRVRKLREYAEHEGMSVAELAITFMRDLPGVSSLVLGADNADQVRANVKFFEMKPISEETNAALRRDFYEVDIPRIMETLVRIYKERGNVTGN